MPIVPQVDTAAVLPLVSECGLHGHLTFAYAVLEGRQPGFVMNNGAGGSAAVSASAAIICNYSGFMLAFGRPDPDLARAFLAEWPNHPVDYLGRELYGCSAAWADLLHELLPEHRRVARLGYVYRPGGNGSIDGVPREIPPGLRLVPIDETLAESILDGSGTFDFGVDPWFIRISGGAKAYAALGLGMALVDEQGRVASLCGVCALGGGEAEMEVGTPPPYRGRGLAPVVCAAFMQQARDQGWQPAYTTAKDNAASIRVAHKLGFVAVEEIRGVALG